MTGSTGDLSFLARTPPALPGVSGRKVGETLVALKGRLKPSRWGRRPFGAHPGSMPSLVALAKRALVAALKSVARSYGVRVDLTAPRTAGCFCAHTRIRVAPWSTRSGRREKGT